MRKLLLLLLPLAAPVLAQEGPGTADKSIETYNALYKEYQAATRDFYADYQAARKKDPKTAFDFSKHPDRAYGAKFNAFAATVPGTDGAAKALAQVVRLDRNLPSAQTALKTLLDDYIKSEALRDVVATLRYMPKSEPALRRIIKESPHPGVQGFATLILGQVLKSTGPKEALRLFTTVKEKYADLPYYGRSTLGATADAEIYETRFLSVGKQVPDIVGEDLDGNPMKLSDFRGKIVFLDFWGDW